MLNKGQQETVEGLNKWIKSTRHNFAVINAPGGYGKGYTVREWLKQSGLHQSEVILSAPTHEVVNQLCEDSPGFSGCTIHKLLGFRPTETNTEKQILVRAGFGADTAKPIEQKLVILDEAFYTPATLLHEIFSKQRGTKWLFLGDPLQLPPVQESHSTLLDYAKEIPHQFTLTENMRASDPKQEQFMLDIREQGFSFDFKGLLTRKPRAIDKIEEMSANNDEFTFLAWRHKVVNNMAVVIREHKYGYTPDMPPQVGEIIRVSNVVDMNGNDITRPYETVEVTHWAKHQLIVLRSDGTKEVLPIDCDGKIDELKLIAIKSCERKDWRKYHNANRQHVKIFPHQSATTHSYQGRTVNHAVLDLSDIRASNMKELLYVAVSRSRTFPTMYL